MRIALLSLLALLPVATLAQPSATLTGRVSDPAGGALAGVSVFVPGTLAATFSEADGTYRLEEVPPGGAEVHFSLAGYRSHTAIVEINEGATAVLDVVLRRRPFWERALLFSPDPDAGAAPFALDRTLEADGLPARTVEEAAALLPGIIHDERGRSLAFRHDAEVAQMLDGVALPAPMALPWPGVERLTLYGEHTPATLARGRDALLDVTTRRGDVREAWAEGLASPVSPAGLAEVRGALGLPLLGGRVRGFVAGSLARQDDSAPSPVPLWQLKPEALARLRAHPQEAIVRRIGDPADVRYLPLPAGLPQRIALDDLAALIDVPVGYELTEFLRVAAHPPYSLTADDFEQTRTRRHAAAETGNLLVRAGMTIAATDFDLTYADAADRRDVWVLSESLFRDNPYGRTETRQRYLRADVGRAFGPVDLRFTAAAYRDRATTFDPRFPSSIESIFDYGDLSHPANAVAARYRIHNSAGDSLRPMFADGSLHLGASGSVLFALPGAAGIPYTHAEMDAHFLRLVQTAAVRGHALTLGAEYQGRVRRAITVPNPTTVARYATATTGYADLLDRQIGSLYYGYDYLGLERADDEDFDAFMATRDCQPPNSVSTCRTGRRIAPFERARVGVYGADRFALGPIQFDVGLRYDRFSHNRPQLYDPYTLLPVVRAGDLASVPNGIAPDYAVLYDQGAAVVGYRSRDGRYFDRTGQEVAAETLRLASHRSSPDTQHVITRELLVDAPAHGVFQPRVALSVSVAPRAAVWLSYNRAADLPADAFLNATLQRYTNAGAQEVLPNAALRPEIATTYALGGQVAVGRARLGLSLSQQEVADVAYLRQHRHTFPMRFETYASEGHVRVRSIAGQVQIERTGGVALEASYTLSQSKVSLPAPSAADVIVWASDPFYPRGREATRHVLSGVLDYRTEAGEGPRIGGWPVFERMHVALAAEARNGERYTGLSAGEHIHSSRLPMPKGRFDGQSLPWTALVHLHAERGFAVRGHVLTVFAQVRNLLDAAPVRRVYAATGDPADDGYLSVPHAQQEYPEGSVERLLYQTRTADPDHYGLPREVRLGVRLAL